MMINVVLGMHERNATRAVLLEVVQDWCLFWRPASLNGER